MVKIAVIQMTSSEVVEENIDFIKKKIILAASHNAKHIFLPETANFIHPDKDYCLEYAESDRCKPFCDAVSFLAKQYGLYIHIGSVKYRIADHRLVNRSISYAPSGEVCAEYDKIHLFDVVLSKTESYHESYLYNHGKNAVILETIDFTLGYSICYDLRFPELYYDLACSGANLIAVPAAFTVPTGQAHWEVLLRSRAIETGSYIIAAAQGGVHYGGRQTYGHSMIISPWGEIICESTSESVSILYAEIDIQQSVNARSKVNSLNHRVKYGMTYHKLL